MQLQEIAQALNRHDVFKAKQAISTVFDTFGDCFSRFGIENGDDAAAIADGQGGWLLLACEGILPALCEENPELAGRSAVLANVNDIYAMGGRPLAMVNVVGGKDQKALEALLTGMRDNALRFNVPIVGGHLDDSRSSTHVSLAVLGRAKALISSFDARPGDALVLVTNLDGLWLRGPNFYNCTLPRHDPYLVRNLELIAKAAEAGLVLAGKDVSMAGVAGTLIMLCEGSKVGAILDLSLLPMPTGCHRDEDMEAWLRAFFSFGFLFAIREEVYDAFVRPFREVGLSAERIGRITSEPRVVLTADHADPFPLYDIGSGAFLGM